MSTASTGCPSAVENSVLRAVPCVAARVSTSVSESGVSRSDNAFRNGTGRVLTTEKSVASPRVSAS